MLLQALTNISKPAIIRITPIHLKGVLNMTMQEASRLILGLRAAGWSDTQIADFILWIESGDPQYKPQGTPTPPPAQPANPNP